MYDVNIYTNYTNFGHKVATKLRLLYASLYGGKCQSKTLSCSEPREPHFSRSALSYQVGIVDILYLTLQNVFLGYSEYIYSTLAL